MQVSTRTFRKNKTKSLLLKLKIKTLFLESSKATTVSNLVVMIGNFKRDIKWKVISHNGNTLDNWYKTGLTQLSINDGELRNCKHSESSCAVDMSCKEIF